MLQQLSSKIQIVLNFQEYHQNKLKLSAQFKFAIKTYTDVKVNIGLSVSRGKLELMCTSLYKKWGSSGPLLFLNVTVSGHFICLSGVDV